MTNLLQMKKYNLINNALGWACFIIAAVTYLLTIEPTASFWDCPEFILQGFKLEVGHPPGNPIFMLAARFFVNFAGGDVTHVAMAVNAMSALLAAGTILLLFWTITHLVKRLLVKDGADTVTPAQMALIFGAGICGTLAFTWSDTFWFSAVEGEVYAFSSFCTALVFWLILKWEDHADSPASDRYLILIAYIIGISIGVHLLNLLCIPAIVLVIYYRKWTNTTAKGSLIALCISAVIVGMILYGLVPGFIEIAQYFELMCVNGFGWSYNMGALLYAVLLVAVFIWSIARLYGSRPQSFATRAVVWLALVMSGIFFIGDSLWIALLLAAAAGAYLGFAPKIPVRVMNITMISILVIFIGYSSYALLLIRSSANPPMNQNAPDNVFALASYLNREQYGERPLFYGQTIQSSALYQAQPDGSVNAIDEGGRREYGKIVKDSPEQADQYVMTGEKRNYRMTPELNMLFPRIYSGPHTNAYQDWTGMTGEPVEATLIIDEQGNPLRTETRIKPTQAENMRYFLTYQLNHMYWRYFLWNFAGRQNDIQGDGEVNHGNWISGIPFIDNPRLGDQKLLPYDEGEGNKGHNVFYMLPLLLGVIGLLWQAFCSKRGIEQFWVVFFLFFMTGIAIVIYLNQTPTQPRERDYAFAGSFYAFAIWIGMGVAGLWAIAQSLLKKRKESKALRVAAVAVPVAVGILVPMQMVSQTWDDHDRSGRTAARDFGMNYLNSLDPNAIIFTNGDNDTFPLWYAQEVEGVRTDVKVVNQSYLTTSWYVDMMRQPSYEAAGIDMEAPRKAYAHDAMQFNYLSEQPDTMVVSALESLKQLYSPTAKNNSWGVPMIQYPRVAIPVDIEKAVKDKHITAAEAATLAQPYIFTDLREAAAGSGGLTIGNVISLDMLATSMKNGWNRPVYFAMTVPEDYYLGLTPYMRSTGLAYEVTPLLQPVGPSDELPVDTDRAYRNITEKFRWGGLDTAEPGSLYLDETVRRMVTTVRTAMVNTAAALLDQGYEAKALADSLKTGDKANQARAYAADRFAKTRTMLQLIEKKLPGKASPYALQVPQKMALTYFDLGTATGNKDDHKQALRLIDEEIMRYGTNIRYYQSLNPRQYATLRTVDKYIDQTYMGTLLQLYHSMGGDVEKIAGRLEAMGVDFNRLSQTIMSRQAQP